MHKYLKNYCTRIRILYLTFVYNIKCNPVLFIYFFDIIKLVIIMLDIDTATNNFGKRIQEARLLRNITQDQLAEYCDVTPKHISAIERGSSAGSIALLLHICDYLQITPNSLFVDSIIESSQNDTIIPIDKHETVLKYSKLSKSNQDFIDSSINHLFDEQTRKV